MKEAFSKRKSFRLSMSRLTPNVRNALTAFDYDGDGRLSSNEIARGAEQLQETQKRHRAALWALGIQFVIYAILTAASAGVLYHFLYLMKDTAVDASTGTLVIKGNGADDTGKASPVSVKSVGTAFTYDATAVNATTGLSKGCVYPSQASEIFVQVLEGTNTQFVHEDDTTGDIRVVPLGNGMNGTTWTDDGMDFGGLVLVPDVDCTEKYLLEEHSPDHTRRLSDKALYDANRALRRQTLSAFVDTSSSNRQGRRGLSGLPITTSSGRSTGREISPVAYTAQQNSAVLSACGKIMISIP